MRHKLCKFLQTTIIAPIYDTSTDVSKISPYNLGYICTFLESLSQSELMKVFSTFYAKLTTSYGRIIAIGMHIKPCIASLAFTTCNWEMLSNTELILLQKKAFSD